MVAELLKKIATYAHDRELALSDKVEVNQTLYYMEQIARNSAWQVKELAEYLEGDTVAETCSNIWHFLRARVTWLKERGEQLRTPAVTLSTGLGDCDCTSIATSALLLNLKIPHSFLVVAHIPESPEDFTHVFVTVQDGDQEIYIDVVPEIDYYNAKNIEFFKQLEYTMSTTMLYGLGTLSPSEMAFKNALEEEYRVLQEAANFAIQNNALSLEGQKELAIMKSVIAYIGDDANFERVILNAIQNSSIASEEYNEFYQDWLDSGMSGLGFLKKLKQKLDKLGETGIGKAFRKLRDKTIRPALRTLPGGAAIDAAMSKAGDAFNNAAKNEGRVQFGAPQDNAALIRTRGNTPQSPMVQTQDRSAARSTMRQTAPPANTEGEDKPENTKGKIMLFFTKNKKPIFIGLVVLVVIAVVYMTTQKKPAKRKKSLRGGKRKTRKVTDAQLLKALQARQPALAGGAAPKRRRKKRKTTSKYRVKVAPKRTTTKRRKKTTTRKRRTKRK